MPEPRLVVRIRPAEATDAPAIASIYNHAVVHTVATMDTEPRSVPAQLRWLDEHVPPWLAVVAESGGRVVGWASLSRWSDRPAYATTAEVSVYVDAAVHGRGAGGALLDHLLEAARQAGFHSLLARVAGGNEVSLGLHLRRGFVRVGVMREVGWKHSGWVDVHLLERLAPPARVPPDAISEDLRRSSPAPPATQS